MLNRNIVCAVPSEFKLRSHGIERQKSLSVGLYYGKSRASNDRAQIANIRTRVQRLWAIFGLSWSRL